VVWPDTGVSGLWRRGEERVGVAGSRCSGLLLLAVAAHLLADSDAAGLWVALLESNRPADGLVSALLDAFPFA